MKRGLTLAIVLAGAVRCVAAPYGFQIEPGRRVGHIGLGMTQAGVHALLRAPSHVLHAKNGVWEVWLSRTPYRVYESGSLRRVPLDRFVCICFLRGRVQQIEASSDAFELPDGKSTGYPVVELQKTHPGYKSRCDVYFNPDPGMSTPAAKHFVVHDDSRAAGIAWKYDVWGSLSPEADPESPPSAIIVHPKGRPVLLDPMDGLPFGGQAAMSYRYRPGVPHRV